MCAIRRTAFTRATRLAAKASPYHSAVTLYDAQDTPEAGPSTLPSRRSNHIKRDTIETSGLSDSDANEQLPALKRRKSRKKTKVALELNTTETVLGTKSRSPKKPKAIPQSLDIPHPAPARWKEAYDAIMEMRSRIVAPVDTMGCDQAQLKEQDPKNQRFATLVSLMLSSQTKDEVTDAAVAKLRSALGGSLSVEGVLAADDATISESIAKVGFWRRKTQYIKQTARRLRDDFESDVPKTVDELCSLPGVGPKMAFLALQVAWNLNLGIGVDVHVHRITNRLGWHERPTKNPEETRLNLQSWLPKELHGEINHMLVGFGQMMCLPVGPKCSECALNSAGLCPSAQKGKSSKSAIRKRTSTVGIKEDSGPKVEIEIEIPENIATLSMTGTVVHKDETE
ncbi:DNA glycosylase [Gyrodon lividus]|nr:DNA glycosylase [Gyrodon lividus]